MKIDKLFNYFINESANLKSYNGEAYLFGEVNYYVSEILGEKNIYVAITDLDYAQSLLQRARGQRTHPVIIKIDLNVENLLTWDKSISQKYDMNKISLSNYENLKLNDNGYRLLNLYNGLYIPSENYATIHFKNGNFKILGYSVDEGNNQWSDFMNEEEINNIIESF